jgi:hypothetical protein
MEMGQEVGIGSRSSSVIRVKCTYANKPLAGTEYRGMV